MTVFVTLKSPKTHAFSLGLDNEGNLILEVQDNNTLEMEQSPLFPSISKEQIDSWIYALQRLRIFAGD